MVKNYFKNKTITIFGLGRYEHGSGLATVKFLLRQGANLIITDLNSEQELSEQIQRVKDFVSKIHYKGQIQWHMGGHKEEDVTDVDMVIPNPAVPVTSRYIQLALNVNIPVETEMTLFFAQCPAKIVGVTGTRGKSTTTALIAHLLKDQDTHVWMGGNIAKSSPLDFLDEVKKDDIVVLELSNFMLEYLDLKHQSPEIAVLLNVLPDHLNRYQGSMDQYVEVKNTITKYQTKGDVLICNDANKYSKQIGLSSKAKVVWFNQLKKNNIDYYVKQTKIVESLQGEEKNIVDINSIQLKGKHNIDNILAAVACVRQLIKQNSSLQESIDSFVTLAGRLQIIKTIDEVDFINDTTSTTPIATQAALQAFEGDSIILIAGGADKGLDFTDMVRLIKDKVKLTIWLSGAGTDKIKEVIKQDSIELNSIDAKDMGKAVSIAYKEAKSGDVVLLSPACASFGFFKNEFDRGDQFNKAVNTLTKK